MKNANYDTISHLPLKALYVAEKYLEYQLGCKGLLKICSHVDQLRDNYILRCLVHLMSLKQSI